MQFNKKFHIPVKFQIENAIISSVSRVKLLENTSQQKHWK